MKKITFVTVAILVSVAAFAQRGIPRTDNVSVSSTVVKKTTKQSDYQKGFQQSVELGTKIDFLDKGTTGVNYIGSVIIFLQEWELDLSLRIVLLG